MIERWNFTHAACRRLVLVTLGLLLAGSSVALATPGCEARTRESIPAERLADWEPLDDHTLLVWTLNDARAHLLTLDRPLPGLLGAPTLFLVTHDHRRDISPCGQDEVVVPGSGAARITAIRYLSEKRTAELDRNRGRASRAKMTSI